MNLADQIIQTLAEPDWIWFPALAQSLFPDGYTAEDASVLAAACRDLADEGRVECRGADGIIHQIRLIANA